MGCAGFSLARAPARRRMAIRMPDPAGKAVMLPSNQMLLRQGVQAKLRLTQEGDPYEREADKMTEIIVAGGRAGMAGVSTAPVQVSRVCDECEEDEKGAGLLSRQMDESVEDPDLVNDTKPDETGMPKRMSGSGPASVSGNVVPKGPAHPMAADVRGSMESGFGVDFGSVQLHADAAAARSASHLGALAYTVGNDIYFGSGQYSPSTQAGTKLLAHELTHVVQQQRASASLARKPAPKKKKEKAKASGCSGNCPQGKQKKVTRGDCGTSSLSDKSDYITHLEVSISKQTVTPTWSSGKAAVSWPCSPNPRRTPKGKDTVGVKCGISHTNRHKDGMAWFTSFDSEGLRIGFHDSQRVGKGIYSHGCVRVCCNIAKLINKNTWSGKTTIHVS